MHLLPARLSLLLGLAFTAVSIAAPEAQARAATPGARTPWRISGDLTEACTCSVPCTCNFGEGSSPHSYCWALFSLDIRKGRYGSTRLDGLRLAAATAAKGIVVYLDDRATPRQAEALTAIGTDIHRRLSSMAGGDANTPPPPELTLLGFETVRIDQHVGDRSHRLSIGDRGGFESDYILGIDGKTPVVVENNWSWNIRHGIKAKAKRLHYKDRFGNEIDASGVNANQGKFDWSDKTEIYFR